MEPFFHYFIPTAFLLVAFPQYRKIALWLSPLTFVPDLDWLFFDYHRLLLNTVFFIVLIGLLFYWWKGKTWGWIAAYYIFSHVLFDSGFPGGALFWPLSSTMYYLTFKISHPFTVITEFATISHADWLLIKENELSLPPILTEVTHSYYISTEGFLVLILALILFIVVYRHALLRFIKTKILRS